MAKIDATQQRQMYRDMIVSMAAHLADQVTERNNDWNGDKFSWVGVDDLASIADRLAELVAFMSNGTLTKDEVKEAARGMTDDVAE